MSDRTYDHYRVNLPESGMPTRWYNVGVSCRMVPTPRLGT